MKIRLGMVGGGPGAFIGGVHRMAAALDGHFELVAGSFSSDPVKSAAMGAELALDPARAYASFEEMAASEAALAPETRIEAVSIVTPNHLHHAAAMAFLRTGVHVICDKPLATKLADAEELCRESAQRDLLFCVTHNYSGYPMVKEAAERVSAGELGVIRKIVVEYSQGWLATLLEAEGHKQASWRADPERAGASSALGDIGTHAYHLAGYVTGMEPSELFADLGTLVPGRVMEDDATILMRYEGGARGLLTVSQVATGERNHLRLRVYGSKGGLDWSQEQPDRLRCLSLDGAETILHDGGPSLSDRAVAFQRLPAGHPEGFIEAFANVYAAVGRTLVARSGRIAAGPYDHDFPSAQDGARGAFFVEAALRSAAAGAWETATYSPPA